MTGKTLNFASFPFSDASAGTDPGQKNGCDFSLSGLESKRNSVYLLTAVQ